MNFIAMRDSFTLFLWLYVKAWPIFFLIWKEKKNLQNKEEVKAAFG